MRNQSVQTIEMAINNKTIKSKYGQFDVSIPRDRNSSFAPQLVKKREVLLDGSKI